MEYGVYITKLNFTTAHMIHTIKNIYDRLCIDNMGTFYNKMSTQQIELWLNQHINKHPNNDLYKELLIKIQENKSNLTPLFIENFCLDKLVNRLLDIYPINIAEAFVLAYITLNKLVSINFLYFKLGSSGLLSPTLINGEYIQDIEAVAQFIIKSLNDAQLISITDSGYVMSGTKLSIH